MSEFEEFVGRFDFNPKYRGYVGVEREMFLVDEQGQPVPKSPQFLALANGDSSWTYELSACQIEHRTPRLPSGGRLLLFALNHGEAVGTGLAAQIGCRLAHLEVAQEGMPLDVYPHDERYAEIKTRLENGKLSAACRVAGTHIHFGMGSLEEAIDRYNRVIPYIDRLVELGDHSSGRRLELYGKVAGRNYPAPYRSADHFYQQAVMRNFDQNPRNCWDLVRISRHGTVEIRVFGVTSDNRKILEWEAITRSILFCS
jgi:gamma-glutamyl:cysteine ligase YbdK (ATP-grasp superfamily)